MPRRPNLIPPVKLTIALPSDVEARLRLHLYSELEGRVPMGSHQRFFMERIAEYFNHRHLDLAPWTGAEPGAFIVSATPETLVVLERALKGEVPI